MISGIDLNAVVEYQLKGDTENPTTWKLGVIPSYLLAKVSSEAQNNEIETTFRLLQLGLKGWENCNIQFTTVKEKMFGRELEVVPISLLEQLDLKVITELSMKVMEVNKLTNEERKN